MENHTIEERMNGICRWCTLEQKNVKKCFGFGMIGDRSCNNKYIPGHRKSDKIILCKYIKKYQLP